MRVPPSAVSSSTSPAGSARTSPSRTASAPSGCARSAASASSAASGGDDRDQLALVRDVERVDAEDLAGGVDRRAHGQRALVEDDREPGRLGELVERGREPAPGRVAHPAQRRRRARRAPPRARARQRCRSRSRPRAGDRRARPSPPCRGRRACRRGARGRRAGRAAGRGRRRRRPSPTPAVVT